MQQRVKHNKSLRTANRLLEMRDDVRKQFGERYDNAIAPFIPFTTIELQRCGCPQLTATRVLRLLSTQQQSDLAVKRLVMCAALEVALHRDSLPLAG